MNWESFFTDYTKKFGGFSAKTESAIKAIIQANDTYKLSIAQLAYLLATAYHETAHDFIPKKEYGSADYFIRRYWNNLKQRVWLGNDTAQEAVKYCGRGLVQITGEVNYEKFGIADDPEKALELAKAIEIIYKGMMGGMFTGKKLSKYINEQSCDFYDARRVINGLDKASLIEGYANGFYRLLKNNS